MMRAWTIVAALLASLTAAFGQSPPFPTTLPSNTVVGNLSPVAGPGRAVSIAALQAAVLNGGVRAITGSDTILTSDLNKTLYMSGALGTLTVPSAANFPAGFTVSVLNGNTTRGQKITGLSNVPATAPCSQHGSASGTQCILYPLQTIVLRVVSSGWAITKQAGPWMIQAGQTVVFNVDPAVGSDTNDGLATGSGNAFATLQHCIDTVSGSLYLLATNSGTSGNFGRAKCKLATQTNNEAVILRDCQGDYYREGRACTIEGDTVTPANVVMKGASVGAVFSAFGALRPWYINGVSCSPTLTTDDCFFADRWATMDIGSVSVPTAARNVIFARYQSNIELISGAVFSVTANINSFATATYGAQILGQGGPGSETGTVSGSTLGSAYAFITDQASMVDLNSITWTGTFTGTKAFINGGSSGAATPSSYPATVAVSYSTPFAFGEMPLGTPGGVVYFQSDTTQASSAALTQNRLVLGGGTGAPSVVGSLGTTTTVLHGNAAGAPTFGAVANADLANSATTVAGQTCTLGSTCGLSSLSNYLTGDVALNNTGSFFAGPVVAQGSTGTWFASGTIALLDTAGGANFHCKLYDGTTVIASASISSTSASQATYIHLSGFMASPAGNIRIDCQDASSTSGAMKASIVATNKDSSLFVFRIN